MQGDLFVFVFVFVFVIVRTKEKDESSLIVWKLEASANQAKFLLLSLRWKCWEAGHEIWSYIKHININTRIHKYKCTHENRGNMEMVGGACHEIWSYIKYTNTNTQIHKHTCKNTTNTNMSNIEMVGGPSHET